MGAILFVIATAAPAADVTPPGHAVASAHPLATRAGMQVLAAGGNAFDAAVAVSAALAVVEPTGSGLGGGGFWLLHRASDGLQTVVDGRETAPAAATPDMFLASGKPVAGASLNGPRAAGIPGEPAALAHIARRYGSKPLAELLAPAIACARDGFAVDPKLARMIAEHAQRFSPAAAAVFAPRGQPLATGALLRQPDLATTLEQLARDAAALQGGEPARRWAAAVRQDGGLWSDEDLRRYQVLERKPLQFWFRDHRITSAPPPSAGGVALGQALQMLEARGGPIGGGLHAKHLIVEVLRRAFHDRARWLGDPAFVAVPVLRLLSREYVLALARGIDPAVATPSAGLVAAGGGTQTTHFSVLDEQGNRAAGTLSINLPFGSGYMAAGTGVLLNNEMDDFATAPGVPNAYGLVGSAANAIAPGKRPLSSMSPTFVEGPRGLLIVGTPGGSRIISMVLLAVLGFTDGLDAAQIAAQPRFHHQYLPDAIEFEPGALTAAEQAGLRQLGHALKPVENGYGNLQAVLWDPRTGRLEAAADPRGVGTGEVRRTRLPPATATTAPR